MKKFNPYDLNDVADLNTGLRTVRDTNDRLRIENEQLKPSITAEQLGVLIAENATLKENNNFLLKENASLRKSIDGYMNGSEVAKLRELLKKSQWLRWHGEKMAWTCWYCHGEVDIHAPNCALAAALRNE